MVETRLSVVYKDATAQIQGVLMTVRRLTKNVQYSYGVQLWLLVELISLYYVGLVLANQTSRWCFSQFKVLPRDQEPESELVFLDVDHGSS